MKKWIVVKNNNVVAVETNKFDTTPEFGEWIEVDADLSITVGNGYTNGVVVYPPAPTYAALRQQEYPTIGDQLDALWKGGDAAAEMLAKVQAVKAKFPKPTE
jgi:hypothetical protein